jgi:ubiquinone/menaquinone biosynthesis C-methylase UbiE
MALITIDDLIETYAKIVQRGGNFILSKFSINQTKRTKSAFNAASVSSSNWWMIPMVRERWNTRITGKPHQNYRQYIMENHFKTRNNLKLLSLGSGSCSHELELAGYKQFAKIVCIDLAENRLKEAEIIAKQRNYANMEFVCSDINDYPFPISYFDIVLFNSSLHHFENVKKLLNEQMKSTLTESGYLVINEYVGPNRLQYPKSQIKAINQVLPLIDIPYRKRFKTNLLKRRFYGYGLIRMKMADPSECIDSASIIPAIHEGFTIIEEKPYGGNILMATLKDIAHHFLEPDERKKEILMKLFQFEDEFLLNSKSDFLFGIYRKSIKKR